MKYFKHVLVVIAIVILLFSLQLLMARYNGGDNSFALFLWIFLFSFFTFNISVRKIVWFKPYFTSSFNFLNTRFRTKIEIDIPNDLMFDKVVEVLNTSNFKVLLADQEQNEIFAISSMSFKSWGENIYIDFCEEEGKTIMNFCSVTFSQLYSWGKNEQNYNKLAKNIEESLII